jgi:hypothetical protein
VAHLIHKHTVSLALKFMVFVVALKSVAELAGKNWEPDISETVWPKYFRRSIGNL